MPPKNKKKGRAPKHQNSFAFRHNPKSKKTDKILSSPNTGVCRRCYDKIEWRKKYRKYKPRTQLGKCNLCFQKNINAAYHTICTKCAGSEKAIMAMEKQSRQPPPSSAAVNSADDEETNDNKDESISNDGTAEVEVEAEAVQEDDITNTAPDDNDNNKTKRRIRVCEICANEPALSRYTIDGNGISEEVIAQMEELEEVLETGIHSEDGHKLTLREIKGVERQLEKLRLDATGKGKKKDVDGEEEEEADEGEEEEGDNDEDDESSNNEESVDENGGNDANEIDNDDDANDPFLLAIGGKDKLLVGEEYQKMLLAREQSKK